MNHLFLAMCVLSLIGVRAEERMSNDSPFRRQDQWRDRYSRFMEETTSPESTAVSMAAVEHEYNLLGRKFMQLYSHDAKGLMHVDAHSGQVAITKEDVDGGSLFQLDHSHGELGTARIESVRSCLVLCLAADLSLYTMPSSHSDPACHFRVARSSDSGVGSFFVIVSASMANDTHMASIAAQKRHLGGQWIAKNEGVSAPHTFLFRRVDFQRLKTMLEPQLIGRVYRNFQRFQSYCPQRWKHFLEHRSRPRRPQRCSAIVSARDRRRCRGRRRRRRCRRRRTRLGVGSDQLPCSKRERSKWPWPTRNCSELESIRDRKSCRREKRIRCRRKMLLKKPQWGLREAREACKARRSFHRCLNRHEGRARAREKCLKRTQDKMGSLYSSLDENDLDVVLT